MRCAFCVVVCVAYLFGGYNAESWSQTGNYGSGDAWIVSREAAHTHKHGAGNGVDMCRDMGMGMDICMDICICVYVCMTIFVRVVCAGQSGAQAM